MSLRNYNPVKKVRGQDFAQPLSMDQLVPRKDISKLLSAAANKLADKVTMLNQNRECFFFLMCFATG